MKKKHRKIQKIITHVLNLEISPRAEKRLAMFSEKIQNPSFKKKAMLEKCLLQVLTAASEEEFVVVGPVSTELGIARVIVNNEKFVLAISARNSEYELNLEMEVVSTTCDLELTERITDASWHSI